MTGLFGGAFDPPHNGHVALLAEAERRFDLERLVVLVVAAPGHKDVWTDAETRLELARLALPGREVELDPHARTIDTLRGGQWEDPLFLIGADEFADLLSWKEPAAVLELARLGVATRPGYPQERLEAMLRALDHPDRVTFFEIDPVPVSSSDLRARVKRGEPIDGLVPPAVAAEIHRLGLYRGDDYTGRGNAQGD